MSAKISKIPSNCQNLQRVLLAPTKFTSKWILHYPFFVYFVAGHVTDLPVPEKKKNGYARTTKNPEGLRQLHLMPLQLAPPESRNFSCFEFHDTTVATTWVDPTAWGFLFAHRLTGPILKNPAAVFLGLSVVVSKPRLLVWYGMAISIPIYMLVELYSKCRVHLPFVP